jgi:hypothetical protein
MDGRRFDQVYAVVLASSLAQSRSRLATRMDTALYSMAYLTTMCVQGSYWCMHDATAACSVMFPVKTSSDLGCSHAAAAGAGCSHAAAAGAAMHGVACMGGGLPSTCTSSACIWSHLVSLLAHMIHVQHGMHLTCQQLPTIDLQHVVHCRPFLG